MTAFLAAQGYPASKRALLHECHRYENQRTRHHRTIPDGLGYPRSHRIHRRIQPHRTVVTHVDSTPPALSTQNAVLFDRFERSKLEEAQPHRTVTFTLDHTIRRFNVTLHTTRFGGIGTRGPSNPALDQTYAARWVTDANVTVPIVRHFLATVGVNNIADVYPSEIFPPQQFRDPSLHRLLAVRIQRALRVRAGAAGAVARG